MKKLIKTSAALLAALLMLTGCSASDEELLADTWYIEGKDNMSFDLYSDGTCKIANSYGTGKWEIVNGNQLKLTDYYGQSQTVTIDEISEGKLVVSSNGRTQTYVNTAE